MDLLDDSLELLLQSEGSFLREAVTASAGSASDVDGVLNRVLDVGNERVVVREEARKLAVEAPEADDELAKVELLPRRWHGCKM